MKISLDAEDLRIAVEESIISAEQAEALDVFAQARHRQINESELENQLDFSVSPQDEPFRLLKGFRDIFVALGVVILSVALSTIVGRAFGMLFGNKSDWLASQASSNFYVVLLALYVVIFIGLSEVITRRQKFPLAGLALTLGFALWVGLTIAMIAILLFPQIFEAGPSQAGFVVFKNASQNFATIAGFGAVFGLVVYYWRYKLPFVLLPLAGVAVGTFISITNMLFDFSTIPDATRILIAISGIGVFGLAMWFDLQDRHRVSRLSECAFWLHLLAAPLIVHAVLFGQKLTNANPILILMVVALLSVLALLIDRRAFLVAALLYLGFTIFDIISSTGMFGEFNNSTALLILGVFVLVLGLAWIPIRRFFVQTIAWKSLQMRLPPVD